MKFSSFKKEQLLMENWRKYNNDPFQLLCERYNEKLITEEQLFATLQITLPTFAAEVKRQREDKNGHLFERYFLETYETGTGPATEFTRGLQQALRTMNGDGKLFNRNAILHRGSSDEEPAAVAVEVPAIR